MPPEDQLRIRRLSYLIGVFGSGVILVLWLFFAFVVANLRDRAWSEAVGRAGNLLRTVERIVGRDIALYDLGIQAVADGLRDPALEGVSPEVRQLSLFDRATQAPGYGAILVLDEHGTAFIDSGSPVPRRLNGADRAYFQVHRDRDAGLFVGPPWRTRVSGRDMIPLSRRFAYADGSFAGVIVGAIELSYLAELFGTLNRDEALAVELVFDGPRGQPVRVPFGRGAPDEAASGERLAAIAGAEAGDFVSAPAGPAEPRYNVFRRVGAYPIRANVSVATARIDDAWVPQALSILLVVAALTAGAVALLAILRRELVRRVRAEIELSHLALTDPLTRLPNRRHFDAALEAARAGPHRAGVAVLLIDVDRFKRYNDRYGHPAGDRVLTGVGAAIRAVAEARAGLAFRIGGEEFAVILVGANERAAIDVAERVRRAVEDLGLAHADGVGGAVTVCVGLLHGSRYPLATGSQWLSLADDALYRAKRAGRNCVFASGLVAPPVQAGGARPERAPPVDAALGLA